jgi:hypothetical protein
VNERCYCCSCGYVPAGEDDLTDHLVAMFVPDDDTGLDGQLHAEAARDAPARAGTPAGTPAGGWRCLCGFSSDNRAGLDAHLLAAFTPPAAIGRDGRRHVVLPRGQFQ